MPFLPVNISELQKDAADFILISADAYVDHPSFGHAIISRMVENAGFSIGIIPQPQCDADYMRFGAPKKGFLISGGVVDSMVNNYTVAKIKRDKDEYSEGGKVGCRPDRAVTVYSRALKRLFPEAPVVIGGIEASLRRFAHYDYWSDKVMPSILVDSAADLLIYGMGERPLKDILALVAKGVSLGNIKDVRGTSYIAKYDNLSSKMKEMFSNGEVKFCPSYEETAQEKEKYLKAFNVQTRNGDPVSGSVIAQKHGDCYVIQNMPQHPLSPKELDEVYKLPYMRDYHPMYKEGVPAIKEVKYSITSVRGCFGSCSYCALTYHQGRRVQKRSKDSIMEEARTFLQDKDFKGYIHDVGGPTANFRNDACKNQYKVGACNKKSCIGFEPCKNLEVSHEEYLDILRSLRTLDGVKKVFVRSGIRFDYVMMDKNSSFLKELIEHHVSGQLKVAPEHSEPNVLRLMNKPDFSVYKHFKENFDNITRKMGKEQYLVPYFISSHPGCTLSDAVKLAEYLHSIGHMPEQVQDFYPTPSTKSTCMYYTGVNPDDMQEVYVPKSREEKRMQRALLQYRKKDNYDLVKQALELAGREDLIGFTAECLIKPKKEEAIINKTKRNSSGFSSNSTKSVRERGEKKSVASVGYSDNFVKNNAKGSVRSSANNSTVGFSKRGNNAGSAKGVADSLAKTKKYQSDTVYNAKNKTSSTLKSSKIGVPDNLQGRAAVKSAKRHSNNFQRNLTNNNFHK